VLLINGTLTGLLTITNAFFIESTPVLLMGTVLLVGGFFRSLQFTGVNSLAFADIEPEQMSQASSFAATAQQIGISLGMGIATVTLDLSMQLRGASRVSVGDIHTGFWVIGLLSIIAAYWFYKLDPKAGEGITVHKERKNRVRFKRRRNSATVSDRKSQTKPVQTGNVKS
ncbi:MAG: MFS transporter, partial [Advenella sp.]